MRERNRVWLVLENGKLSKISIVDNSFYVKVPVNSVAILSSAFLLSCPIGIASMVASLMKTTFPITTANTFHPSSPVFVAPAEKSNVLVRSAHFLLSSASSRFVFLIAFAILRG